MAPIPGARAVMVLDATLSGQERQAAIKHVLDVQHRVVPGQVRGEGAGEPDDGQPLSLFQYPGEDGGEDAASY